LPVSPRDQQTQLASAVEVGADRESAGRIGKRDRQQLESLPVTTDEENETAAAPAK